MVWADGFATWREDFHVEEHLGSEVYVGVILVSGIAKHPVHLEEEEDILKREREREIIWQCVWCIGQVLKILRMLDEPSRCLRYG